MTKAYHEIDRCRICGNEDLVPVLSLGTQALTGVFPRSKAEKVTAGPVDLVRCDAAKPDACGLAQLRQSYDKNEMYGPSYGYHSGLNQSMVRHLGGIVKNILSFVELKADDLVLDIGSNDATLLKAYPEKAATLVGIDPTGTQFKKYYPPHVRLIPEFFSAKAFQAHFPGRKAKVVTSIAMFYDLDAPMDFMAQVRDILDDDGVWVLEQSYLPTMLEMNAYDTICHEHLEYYGLRQIDWMTRRLGLKIVDVDLNDINGGSFAITVAKQASALPSNSAKIDKALRAEAPLAAQGPYEDFKKKVFAHRDELSGFIKRAKKSGKSILGYGASTKGNVILQFCGLTAAEIPFIGEVNEEKFGCFTPGTAIPIISESQARTMRPDYFMVLPWHFKDFILAKEKGFIEAGGRFLFPLPACRVSER